MSWPLVELASLEGQKGGFVDGPFGSNLKATEYVESGVPIIQLKNIKPNAYVAKDIKFITPQKAGELSRHSYAPGDVVIAKLGAVGTACIIPEDAPAGVIVADVVRFRGDSKRVDHRFLCHYLNSSSGQCAVMKLSRGSTRVRTNLSDLKKVEIPLPPLPEQKRIAAILDKADAIPRKRQQAIQLADDFLRAVFLDMFGDPVTNPKGWEVRPLGQISTFENGDRSSAYPSGDDLVSEGVLFLSTKNIVSDTLSLESCQYITEDKYIALSRGKARKGDLIITLRGTLGSCCVFDCEHEKAFINAQMMIIRPDLGVGNIFLHDLLVSKAIKNHLQSIGQGAAVPQLTAKQLKELMLPIPSIQEQKRYEKIRDSVLTSIKKMQSESGISLFEAITQKAFRGEL